MKLHLDEYLEKLAGDNQNNPLWWQQEAKPKPPPEPKGRELSDLPPQLNKVFENKQ